MFIMANREERPEEGRDRALKYSKLSKKKKKKGGGSRKGNVEVKDSICRSVALQSQSCN